MRSRWMVAAIALLTAALAALTSRVCEGEDLTIPSLRVAHQCEVQAARRYAEYAAVAEREGYFGVRDLFTALSRSESVHARIHARSLEWLGVVPTMNRPVRVAAGTTLENLRAAFDEEMNERHAMYGRLMEHARAECCYEALAGFRYARDAEATHARALSQAYFAAADLRDPRAWYVCTSCGSLRSPGSACSCGASAGELQEIKGPPGQPVEPGPVAALL